MEDNLDLKLVAVNFFRFVKMLQMDSKYLRSLLCYVLLNHSTDQREAQIIRALQKVDKSKLVSFFLIREKNSRNVTIENSNVSIVAGVWFRMRSLVRRLRFNDDLRTQFVVWPVGMQLHFSAKALACNTLIFIVFSVYEIFYRCICQIIRSAE